VSVRFLPRLDEMPPGRPEVGGADHPMRKVTREVAFEGGWSPERAKKVAELFDGLAPEWHTRMKDERWEAIRDALERGGVPAQGLCVELGAGTGHGSVELARRYPRLVAVDLSREMLRHRAPGVGWPVRADAARLPLRDGAADVLVLPNMLLFPAEVRRVLAPRGALVWVNSLGDRTPIHLSAEDVGRALPGFDGIASEAGWGTWSVFKRGG
jgi:SAM-dependent methyltransferase